MKALLFFIVAALFSCSNGNGPERRIAKDLREKLMVKNDTITINDFYDVDTIIYVNAEIQPWIGKK